MRLPLALRLLPLALAPLLPAQGKVIPAGMDFVEGPSVLTYPFGRASAAIQLLIDADQLTLQQGLVTGITFRQSQLDPNATSTQTYPAYTKNYQVTAYTVTTNAAVMAANPTTNIGSATGTVVFNGPLNVPATVFTSTFPAPFGISIPFTTPYVFDGAQGNLLLVVETADTAAVPTGTYRIDAVQFRNSPLTGIASNLDNAGCTALGQSLQLTVNATNAVVGGSITQTVVSSALGAFPAVMTGLSFEAQPQNLAPFGMPNCTSWLGPFVSMFVLENPTGGYPDVVWALPNDPAIEGIAFCNQALGIAPSAALADSVTSNGVGARIGANAAPVIHANMSFRGTTWSMAAGFAFLPVVRIDGVFP